MFLLCYHLSDNFKHVITLIAYMKVAGTASVGAVTQDTVQLPDYQDRRKVWKSGGGAD